MNKNYNQKLIKSAAKKNEKEVDSTVNQDKSTLITFFSVLECLFLHFGYFWIKIFFVLTFICKIWTITLGHNMNNKDKKEFTKRGVLWSRSSSLEESCLRPFDVNNCMKDRSNWPRVTLKFALFNHVFHIRCKKKWSLMVYNFMLLLHKILKWKVTCCL